VAVGVFWNVVGEAQIANLIIDRSERKKGFGRRVLKSLLERAKREGCGTSTLEVRASNEAAITLYLHCGFAEKGRRRDFYAHPVDDAVLMEKMI
jgi:ribosomal-protein-alanine N-acetyltransferase